LITNPPTVAEAAKLEPLEEENPDVAARIGDQGVPVIVAPPAEGMGKEDDGVIVTLSTENPPALSPASEIHSQASGASTFWKTLFEEDASIRTKRTTEDSPKGEIKQQGRESYITRARLYSADR
jgi:hypothetical protein